MQDYRYWIILLKLPIRKSPVGSSMRKKTTSEIICENFGLPPETIFQDYRCSWKGSLNAFGRIYLGEEHFLFISNMFGIVKKCCIHIENIKLVEQIGSTDVKIVETNNLSRKQFVFANFTSQKTFKLMYALWKKETVRGEILKDEEQIDFQPEILNVPVHNLPPETDVVQDNQNSSAQKTSQANRLEEGKVEANFFSPQIIESEKQKLVQIQLPCSVQQFYEFFVTDKATVYPRKKHFQFKKSEKIVVTEWKFNEEISSQARQFSALIKVEAVPFINKANLSQVWMLKKPKNFGEVGFEIDIVTQMADVPYASYFNTQESIHVKPVGSKKCQMTMAVAVVFNKSTYLKNTLIKRTLEGMKEDYGLWTTNVNRILEQLRQSQAQSMISEASRNSSKAKLMNVELISTSCPIENGSEESSLPDLKEKQIAKKVEIEYESSAFKYKTSQAEVDSQKPTSSVLENDSVQNIQYVCKKVLNIERKLDTVSSQVRMLTIAVIISVSLNILLAIF